MMDMDMELVPIDTLDRRNIQSARTPMTPISIKKYTQTYKKFFQTSVTAGLSGLPPKRSCAHYPPRLPLTPTAGVEHAKPTFA